MKDVLFLLKPGFVDGSSRYFCPGCATVEGMLSFYPQLREKVEVRYIGYARPRPEIVSVLGPDHQGAPCLVLADPETAKRAPPSAQFEQHAGRFFLNDPVQICEYLAAVHGGDRPHA